MEKEFRKYFGITFPEACNLSEAEKQLLAEKLLLSPTTDVKEVLKIIDNEDVLKSYKNLMEVFDMEIISVTTGDETESDNVLDDDDLMVKMYHWKNKIGLPKETEIEEILKRENLSEGLRDALGTIMFWSVQESLVAPINYAEYLRRFVIGQDAAVADLSILLHEHKLRKAHGMDGRFQLPQSSTIFIGNTGNGKTYMLSKAAAIAMSPIQRINCGAIVPAGIRGNSINHYIGALYRNSGEDMEAVSHGILIFDEIDKLAILKNANSNDFNISLQQEILRFFDKNEHIEFQHEDSGSNSQFVLPVKNLMIIFSGAFLGLEEIIRTRLTSSGLQLNKGEDLLKLCTPDDLIEYGLIPELVSRIPNISVLNNLTLDNFFEILKNNIDSDLIKHINKCRLMNITLEVDDEALALIAHYLKRNHLSIRSANQLLGNLLKDVYMMCTSEKPTKYTLDKTTTIKKLMQMQNTSQLIKNSDKFNHNHAYFTDNIDEFLDTINNQ
ncbi:MAG: AAA family ATPase [bacterium]